MDRWEVVLGAPDKVDMPCYMHDTRLRQITLNVEITNRVGLAQSVACPPLAR